MKSKKLLISLAIVAVFIVIVVILASVLTVKQVKLVYHDFSGKQIQAPQDGGIAPSDVLNFAKGKSIVFLNKTNLMEKLNDNFGEWHAFAVVKEMPSMLVVHIVRREAIAKIKSVDGDIYVDSFGCRANPTENSVIDITSAFSTSTTFSQNEVGKELVFADGKNNDRLDRVIEATLAIWQCNVDIEDMTAVLGESNVFGFDGDDNMLITPKMGGTIKVQSPDVNLTERLIKGFSVYYNDKQNLHDDNYTVVIQKNGNITTTTK